jgi:hypothetical protein
MNIVKAAGGKWRGWLKAISGHRRNVNASAKIN